MRYVAVSFATLGVIFALVAAAFGAMGRSLHDEIAPERTRAWENEWNHRAGRLMWFAGGTLTLAVVLFLLP